MKNDNAHKVFECAIRDGGKVAEKDFNGILACWIVLKSLKEVLGFGILSGNLTSCCKEGMKVTVEFSKS